MNIVDKFKHAVFEEEPVVESPEPASPSNVSGVGMPSISAPSVPIQSTPSSDGDSLYNRLANATGTINAPAISKILDTAKTLESVIGDPSVRLKAAMATAKEFTTVDIANDFGKLMSLLSQEQGRFNDWMAGQKQQVAASEAEIASLEQKLHDLRISAGDNKQKLDRAETGFASAFARRTAEINQLKDQFAGLK
jgi:hypothetical protein